MRLRAMFTVLLLSIVVPAMARAQATASLFIGARVFDGTRVIAATDVLVRDGRIVALGRNLPTPQGVVVVDAKGHTLMPGLIDSHTHVYGDALRDALVFGVTTELDQFTNADGAKLMRAEQAAGRANGRADVFSAGTLATAPKGHGTEYGFAIPTLTRPDEAQAWVDARIAEGSDWIKIVYDDGHTFGIKWPTIDNATLRALITAAHARDRLAVVHVSSAVAAREAIDAGADGLVHLFTDTAPTADFAALVKARGAFVIPTLVVLQSMAGTANGAGLMKDARLDKFIAPSNRGGLNAAFPGTGPGRNYDVALATVKQLHAAGVPILAGTDAPNPGTGHGVSLHGELELLVAAGLTPTEALTAATATPAARFRIKDRGRIAEGLRADLVLVNGDPTKDITATRAIAGVWKGGVRLDREAYVKSIAAAPAAGTANTGDGLISDFENGQAGAKFGSGWLLTTDSLAGGQSKGAFAVVDGGANGSGKSLKITGDISDAVMYAWSGVMWSPGSTPMAPADVSAMKGVTFNTRGDGGTFKLLVMAQSKGFTPLMADFTSSAEWTEVSIPWSAFGIDGKDVMAVMFVGGPMPGKFSFQVDNVRLR